MKKCVKNLDELTEYQKKHARDQYIWLRSCEDEIPEEEYLKENFNYNGSLMDMHDDKVLVKELDEILECKSIEIDTEDEFYIYVDL